MQEALRQQARRRMQTTLASRGSGPLGRLSAGAAKGGARMGGGGGGRVVLDTMVGGGSAMMKRLWVAAVGGCRPASAACWVPSVPTRWRPLPVRRSRCFADVRLPACLPARLPACRRLWTRRRLAPGLPAMWAVAASTSSSGHCKGAGAEVLARCVCGTRVFLPDLHFPYALPSILPALLVTAPFHSPYFICCGHRRSVLSEALKRHFKMQDFGRQIIPELIREGVKVRAAHPRKIDVLGMP